VRDQTSLVFSVVVWHKMTGKKRNSLPNKFSFFVDTVPLSRILSNVNCWQTFVNCWTLTPHKNLKELSSRVLCTRPWSVLCRVMFLLDCTGVLTEHSKIIWKSKCSCLPPFQVRLCKRNYWEKNLFFILHFQAPGHNNFIIQFRSLFFYFYQI